MALCWHTRDLWQLFSNRVLNHYSIPQARSASPAPSHIPSPMWLLLPFPLPLVATLPPLRPPALPKPRTVTVWPARSTYLGVNL